MFRVVPSLQHCVERAMRGIWCSLKLQFICSVVMILGSGLRVTSSLNLEGSVLLKFRDNIKSDPSNSLANWNPNDHLPCNWTGVHCIDGKVQRLDLSGLSLGGTLGPVLGNLSNLKALVLHTNHLSGAIPLEVKHLTLLEVLDLRDNNLTGMIPTEIAKLVSLKRLLLSNNKFDGHIPPEVKELSSLSELQYDEYLGSVNNRKFGLWQNGAGDPDLHPQHPPCSNLESLYDPNLLKRAHNIAIIAHRQLAEQSINLQVPDEASNLGSQFSSQPIFRSSGSFPASGPKKGPFNAASSMPHVNEVGQKTQSSHSQSKIGTPSQKVWVSIAFTLGVAFLLVIATSLYFTWRRRCTKHIGPHKTGISGQLQKAFITGVPKLNRLELETACEDFSNIVAIFDAFTIYKGTLSSGVEISVASTRIATSVRWSAEAEIAYRKKISDLDMLQIEKLSRVNHKNFVNLIGYCEEQEPFTRMLVFEYSPSGNLFEHLHVNDVEHLEWNARVRIIMGVAYCLQYMHHDLNPAIAHSKLSSAVVYLTDDYAAKIAEMPFDILSISKDLGGDNGVPPGDPRENVYDFGILLLEIITGRLPYSEKQGSLVDWASKYLKDKYKDLVDPILKSVKTNELEILCDVIQRCINPDPMQRPTIKALVSRLREVILIAPEAAVPRLSPLWWAELEILSEAA